jgi:hypothetical protein
MTVEEALRSVGYSDTDIEGFKSDPAVAEKVLSFMDRILSITRFVRDSLMEQNMTMEAGFFSMVESKILETSFLLGGFFNNIVDKGDAI